MVGDESGIKVSKKEWCALLKMDESGIKVSKKEWCALLNIVVVVSNWAPIFCMCVCA